MPAADAGTAPGSGQELPPPDMCTTMAVYPGSCRPKATSCIADADCPAAWKCLDAPVPIAEPATGGTQSGSAVDGGAATKSASSNNSGAATSPPTVAPAVKTCESPYDLGIRNGTTKGDGPIGTPGASAPATDNGTSGGGPTMGTPPSGSTQGSGSGSTTSPSAGGCSINPGTDASHFGGLALLTLLGLIAVRRLRRS
ncbi:MAG TPA: hypothetical protein VH374_18250 [Polyangia bacterium]|nr:hypothetical protein [Polyangia bacterium]